MFKKVLFTAALLAVSAGAQAGIEINASKYFAYTVLPARGTSVQTVVVLSNQLPAGTTTRTSSCCARQRLNVASSAMRARTSALSASSRWRACRNVRGSDHD